MLFERALKDYQSRLHSVERNCLCTFDSIDKLLIFVTAIDIWQEYVMFNIGLTADGNAMENVRGILERAVETCGYNVASGSLLWDLYREFEETILTSMSVSMTPFQRHLYVGLTFANNSFGLTSRNLIKVTKNSKLQ